jgi:hypothetical protein
MPFFPKSQVRLSRDETTGLRVFAKRLCWIRACCQWVFAINFLGQRKRNKMIERDSLSHGHGGRSFSERFSKTQGELRRMAGFIWAQGYIPR